MKLNDSFWRYFELDLQEIKLSYLNLALGYAKEPNWIYRHLFQWDHQDCFSPINSRYGRAFSISPYGTGVRGVGKMGTKMGTGTLCLTEMKDHVINGQTFQPGGVYDAANSAIDNK